jgi:hypothetical protein
LITISNEFNIAVMIHTLVSATRELLRRAHKDGWTVMAPSSYLYVSFPDALKLLEVEQNGSLCSFCATLRKFCPIKRNVYNGY